MEQIYYGVAIVVYGVFIVRFILSWVGGDFEIDADADLDLSDLVSFKGATHFLMGASGWLSIKGLTTHNIEWYDYIAAIALGLIFVVVLYFVYKFMMSLEKKPQILTGKQLVGKDAKVYLTTGYDSIDGTCKYIITVDNNVGTMEYPAKSKSVHNVGDSVTISDYENAYYII
jgi:membrane protein implicated in regulation of membrane protease activity